MDRSVFSNRVQWILVKTAYAAIVPVILYITRAHIHFLDPNRIGNVGVLIALSNFDLGISYKYISKNKLELSYLAMVACGLILTILVLAFGLSGLALWVCALVLMFSNASFFILGYEQGKAFNYNLIFEIFAIRFLSLCSFLFMKSFFYWLIMACIIVRVLFQLSRKFNISLVKDEHYGIFISSLISYLMLNIDKISLRFLKFSIIDVTEYVVATSFLTFVSGVAWSFQLSKNPSKTTWAIFATLIIQFLGLFVLGRLGFKFNIWLVLIMCASVLNLKTAPYYLNLVKRTPNLVILNSTVCFVIYVILSWLVFLGFSRGSIAPSLYFLSSFSSVVSLIMIYWKYSLKLYKESTNLV